MSVFVPANSFWKPLFCFLCELNSKYRFTPLIIISKLISPGLRLVIHMQMSHRGRSGVFMIPHNPKAQLHCPTNLSRRVIVFKRPAPWEIVCDQSYNNASCLPWELAIFVQLEEENVERRTLWVDASRSHLHLTKVSMLKRFALGCAVVV